MKRRSDRMERIYREDRRRIVRDLLATYPICRRCHRAASTDVHEIKSRARGGSITELSNLVCLCRVCHDVITQNPAMAEAEGWSKHSWE